MRHALGLSVAFTWFLLVNVLTSLAVATWLKLRPAVGDSLRVAGPNWFLLRVAPTIAGLVFLAGAVVPAYLYFEPRDAAESVGLGTGVLGAISLLVCGWTLGRALKGWLQARDLGRAWRRDAVRLPVAGARTPIWQTESTAVAVTLVGIVRPQLFIARPVVEALSADELEVVVLHETAHLRRRDNLKRLLLLSSPDVLGLTRLGAAIASAWAATAEWAADAQAVGASPARSLTLASALLKVARLVPALPVRPLPVSSLYEGGPLNARVLRLTDFPTACPPRAGLSWWLLAALVAAVVATLAMQPAVVLPVHQATEWLVRFAA